MTELEYIFRLMCARRDVALSKVESVAFNVRINFGLAATYLLPVVANTFYYIKRLNFLYITVAPGGTPEFTFTTNSGQASAGAINIRPFSFNASMPYADIECDSFRWDNLNHTSGDFAIMGTVFKITGV